MLLKFSPKTSHVKVVACQNVEGYNPSRNMVQLLPGTNEVTEDEWACVKPSLKTELETGEVIILAQKVSEGRGKPGGRKAKNLVEMPVNIAVKYVSECINPETLTKWYKEETREEVRIHITKRLQKLGVELPEDDIPEAPNASPMSVEEYESDDDDFDTDETGASDEIDLDDENEDVSVEETTKKRGRPAKKENE